MASQLDALRIKTQQKIKDTADMLLRSKAPTQYVVGSAYNYLSPKINNAFNYMAEDARNLIKGPVSPVPSNSKIITPLRNIAGETASTVIKDVPKIGASVLRLSPPGQSYTQLQAMQNNAQGQLQTQKLQDVYQGIKGIGYITGGAANVVGGAIGMGMGAVGNALEGKPLASNYDKNFAEGVQTSAAFGPISKAVGGLSKIIGAPQTTGMLNKNVIKNVARLINRLDEKMLPNSQGFVPNLYKNIAVRALGRGAREAIEGVATGSVRPLNEGETREQAIASDVAQSVLMGIAIQTGGDLTREKLKPILKNIGLGFEDYYKWLRGQKPPEYKLGETIIPDKKYMSGISIPKELQPLAQEATKYKSADEFIKAQQPIYHGTPKKFDKFDTNISEGNATWFTSDKKDILENTAGAVQPAGSKLNIMERFPKQGLKLATPEQAEKMYTDQLIAEGYRGVKYPKGEYGDYEWTKLFNPNEDTITKSQLTDVWNQAQQTKDKKYMSGMKLPGEMTKAKEPEILVKARQEIKPTTQKSKSIKEGWKQFYTDVVNRFQPVEDIVNKVEKQGKFTIRPEYSPKTAMMRLLGAGGTAEMRHQQELQPVLEMIPKQAMQDFDVYLKARRDMGFGSIGRVIEGSDPVKAKEITDALGTKYNLQEWDGIANQLYAYQNKNLEQLVEAGFIDPQTYQAIKGQNPDYVPFQRVMDDIDNFIGLPTRKLSQGQQPIAKIKGSNRAIISPIESIIADTYKMEAAIAKNRVAQSIAKLSEMMPDTGITKVSQASNNTMPVWENGKKVFYEVPEDVNRVIKGLNEEQQSQVMRLLSIPANILRQGATGKNIDFMLPNVVRDQFDAAINSKYGYVPFVDYFNGLAELIKFKTGNPSIVEDWANSGGKIFYEMAGGRKAIAREIQDATKQKALGRRFFEALNTGLKTMGEYSETPTRLGLYKRALNKTGNKFIAASESREGTLDFARMGAKMKAANSIIPFLNVGVQGFDKLIRNVKNQPGKMLLYGTIYGIAPQIALTVYNNTYHPEEYKEIPDEIKQDNFVFVKGRNPNGKVDYVTMSKGNVLPYITNPVDNLVSAAAGFDHQNFGDLALTLLGDSLPLIEPGRDLNQTLSRSLGSVLPQAIKPAVENIANYSFYKGKQIVPQYLTQKPPIDQSYDSTPTPYKYLGNLLQVSPLRVQNFMEGTFAGGAKLPVQIFNIAQKIARQEQLSPNEIPVIRRFLAESYDTQEQYQKKQDKAEKDAINKEQERKAIAPLQKRLFGEVSAAETPTPTSDIQAVIQTNAKDSKALREYKDYLTGDLTLKNPDQYFQDEYGATVDDLNLRVIKSLNTQDQAEQVYNLMKSSEFSQDKFVKFVKSEVLTSEITKDFLDTGKINKEQKKLLDTLIKNVKSGEKAPLKVSGGKKAKKVTVKKYRPKPIKLKKQKAIKLYQPKPVKFKQLKAVNYKKEWQDKFRAL